MTPTSTPSPATEGLAVPKMLEVPKQQRNKMPKQPTTPPSAQNIKDYVTRNIPAKEAPPGLKRIAMDTDAERKRSKVLE